MDVDCNKSNSGYIIYVNGEKSSKIYPTKYVALIACIESGYAVESRRLMRLMPNVKIKEVNNQNKE